MNTKFCDFTETDKNAIKEIFLTAFDIKEDGFRELFEVYNYFRKDFYDSLLIPKVELSVGQITMEQKKILPRSGNSMLTMFNDDNYIIGIDLPVILSPTEKNGATIFILAEDPLRKGDPNNVIFSTPFGIHRDKIKVYWYVIENLLQKGYSVYLTDIYKLWMKNKDKGSKKEAITGDILENNFQDCLKKEIDYFNPELIITYGNAAANSVKAMSNLNSISFPHPSPSANRVWKEKLKAQGSSDIKCTAVNKSNYIISLVSERLSK